MCLFFAYVLASVFVWNKNEIGPGDPVREGLRPAKTPINLGSRKQELPKAAKIKTMILCRAVRMKYRMVDSISYRIVAVAAKTMPKIKGGNG